MYAIKYIASPVADPAYHLCWAANTGRWGRLGSTEALHVHGNSFLHIRWSQTLAPSYMLMSSGTALTISSQRTAARTAQSGVTAAAAPRLGNSP
jgi:hypothetical protein